MLSSMQNSLKYSRKYVSNMGNGSNCKHLPKMQLWQELSLSTLSHGVMMQLQIFFMLFKCSCKGIRFSLNLRSLP